MTSSQKWVLAIFSILSFTMLFGGAALLENGKISADTYLWIQATAAFIGFFALTAGAEKVLGGVLADFKSSALWWTALLALLAYFARISALDDVNKVFHIDPSALPMTLAAGSVMTLFMWMEWIFIVVAIMSMFVLAFMYKGTYFPPETNSNDKLASGALAVSNVVCCGLAALFINYQLDDTGRQQKLYRIALAADFVSTFRCQGIEESKVSVLFLGPEQRKVVLAQKLSTPVLFGERGPEFLRPLKVPSEFPIVDCVPTVSGAVWSNAESGDKILH